MRVRTIRNFVCATLALVSGAANANTWIHTNATVTGIKVNATHMIVYFSGGTGMCGNGEWPFHVVRAVVGDEPLQSMQSAAMLGYVAGKQISVFGATCESITQIRVHDPNAFFGNSSP